MTSTGVENIAPANPAKKLDLQEKINETSSHNPKYIADEQEKINEKVISTNFKEYQQKV